MSLKNRLGKRIQELRVAHNLKQAELAELVSIATKTQSCIETGKNFPSSDLIERYANVFKLDVSEVLNISHIKDNNDLAKEITLMTNHIINKGNEETITLVYKFLKSITN